MLTPTTNKLSFGAEQTVITALQEQAAESRRRETELRQNFEELSNRVAAVQVNPAQVAAPPINSISADTHYRARARHP